MDLSSRELRSLLGEVKARPPSPADPTIDGMSPSLVLQPDSEASAARALRLCHDEGLATVPVGAGSRLHVGNLPARLDTYLSTSHLGGVQEYEPGDLTVSVRAGTSLGSLQHVLGRERQCLPWDPPQAKRATVGGILASGEAGFRRRPGARPRDLLLGFEALLADGTTVKAGGRVVKNVSGYEITKLLVGSRGTLALITRAHLRLRPLPETLLTLWVSFAGPGEISGAVSRLRGEAVEPQWMAVTDPSFGAVGSLEVWALWLRFEGLEEEVRWEAEKSRRILAPCEGLRAMESWDPGDSERRWQRLRDFPDPREHCAFAMVVRGQVVPSRALQLARSWQGIGPLVAYPDVGCVYVRSDDPSAYSRLLREARILGANAVLESGPPELKKEVDVFGESPGGFELMRKIKQTLDPKRVFSPGRFVGRL